METPIRATLAGMRAVPTLVIGSGHEGVVSGQPRAGTDSANDPIVMLVGCRAGVAGFQRAGRDNRVRVPTFGLRSRRLEEERQSLTRANTERYLAVQEEPAGPGAYPAREERESQERHDPPRPAAVQERTRGGNTRERTPKGTSPRPAAVQ